MGGELEGSWEWVIVGLVGWQGVARWQKGGRRDGALVGVAGLNQEGGGVRGRERSEGE